jgi:deferrochelatase/peroxidase EfeB
VTDRPGGPPLSRRALLAGAVGVGGAAALAGCGAGGDEASGSPAAAPEGEPARVPFLGDHQAGIAGRIATTGLLAAFNSQAADRAELADAFAALTTTAQALMAGEAPPERARGFPPLDSGILGEEWRPDDLSVTVSVGASLFDGRYGLADRKPRQLVRMPFLANDRLDPDKSHGDVLLSIEAGHPDTALHALRQLMRATRGELTLRWTVDGYNRPGPKDRPGRTDVRNLLGFKDGTANLDPADDSLMDDLVWVGPDDGEPAWAVGGSYHVVRLIRMFVEFWDRTRLSEQEAIIGRHKGNGAPLGGDREEDPPRFDDDPDGDRTPLDAHIRLANPRTAETAENRILRRGFSYSVGFDGAGQLDQGLAFVCFQRDLEKGFLTVQRRLAGEPLEEYILPVGGGFFFALPGTADPERPLGADLFA